MCVSAGVRLCAGAGGGAVRPRPGARRGAWEGARAARAPQPPPRDPRPPSRERGRAPRRTWAPEVTPPPVLGRGLTGTGSLPPLLSAGAEASAGACSPGTRAARSGPAPALPARGPALARLGAPGCPRADQASPGWRAEWAGGGVGAEGWRRRRGKALRVQGGSAAGEVEVFLSRDFSADFSFFLFIIFFFFDI